MKGLNLYLINGMYWITASLYLPLLRCIFTERDGFHADRDSVSTPSDCVSDGTASMGGTGRPDRKTAPCPDSAESVLCGGSSALSRDGFLW